jgi:hypothetical protein
MQRETLKLVAVLTVLSLFSHLFLLNSKGYWVDEAYAAGLMQRPASEVIELSSMSTPHPPGAFLLMRASAATAGNSPAGVRLFNALAVASGVVPMFLLSRRVLRNTKGSFLAAMTWVVSPFSVSLGQEAWVYGLPAALSLWFLLFSAVPWKGRNWIPVAWFLTGLAGLYTQFSFLLAVASGVLLMLLTRQMHRLQWVALALLLVAWTPLVFEHLPEMRVRNARLAAAGVNPASAPFRLARNAPLAVAGLTTDGMVPDLYRTCASDPWSAAALLSGLGLALVSVCALALEQSSPLRLRLWALASGMLPFAMFIADSPGHRQVHLAVIPLTIGMGAAFRRFKPLTIIVFTLLTIQLAYWYSLDTNASHRSDWRGAAAYVGSNGRPDDRVLVHSGQSGGVAWDLSGGRPDRIALGGDEDPWSIGRGTQQPEMVADSILAGGERLWLVADLWGPPPLPSGRTPAEERGFGRDLRVYLFLP